MLRFVPGSGGAAGAARRPSRRPRRELGGDAAPPALPQRAAQGRAGGRAAARRGRAGRARRIIMEKPFGTDLAVARGRSTPRCTRSSTRTRSSASTTSSARRRRRTSWPSASPTGCSSRSGTATTSTTCRSTCPRRWASSTRAGFYEATGAYRDMVVTHLFQVLAFMAMEPPTALEPRAISEEKNKVFRSMQPIEPGERRARPVHRLPRRAGRVTRLRDRDVHRAQVRDRQLALGRRAVLPAHRQAHGRGRADHLDRVPGAAEEHVPARLRASARTAPTT